MYNSTSPVAVNAGVRVWAGRMPQPNRLRLSGSLTIVNIAAWSYALTAGLNALG